MHAPLRRLLRTALAVGLLGLLPALAVAQQQNPARQISESQKRLEEIRRERQQLRDEMNRIRNQVRDVSTELRNIERQVSTSAEALRELDFQIHGTEQEVRLTTEELQITQDRLAQRRSTLQRRLRDIYKRGPLHTPQVLLTSASFSDLLNRYKYLFLIARRDRALVGEVGELEHQLVLRDRQLRRSLIELQGLQREKAQEYAEIESLETQRKRTLSSFRAREQTTSRRISQLEQDEKRLASLIATLERRRREAERAAAARAAEERAAAARRSAAGSGATATSARTPAAASSRTEGLTTRDLGNLGWPVDGTLIYRFGRSVQPNGTAIRLNGIGIAAPGGTSVRAVEGGTVVLASPFEGYGPTVVLSHGGGYYSLYLYLKDVSVREGAEVTRGQAVGTVGGSSGYQAAHIEFQIRAPGGQAVDPLSWLQQRGR
ncbi:peptidoglycan DD-metalloendopeptidase family protein [soil metagenome]